MASSHSSELVARIATAKYAVMAETELMHREFGRVESRWKSDGSRVTAVDIEISENIFRRLAAEFPEDQLFSEELRTAGVPIPVTSQYSWVLDPIDGTNNYAAGIAQCAIALALLENGTPVYGVIYDHSRRVLMHGGPGFGLTDGDRQVKVRSEGPTGQSLIGFHTPSERRFAPHAQSIAANFKLRALGSSALHLAYVAAGIFDGTVDHNVKVWDIAAAVPMVQAAGGELLYLTGEVFPLREFDLGMGRIFFLAGSAGTVAALRRVIQPL